MEKKHSYSLISRIQDEVLVFILLAVLLFMSLY